MRESRSPLVRFLVGLGLAACMALWPSSAGAAWTPGPDPHDGTNPYTWDPGNP